MSSSNSCCIACLRLPAYQSGQERYWDAQRGPFKFLPAADIAQAFYGSTNAGKAIQEGLSKPYGQDGMDAPALSTRW